MLTVLVLAQASAAAPELTPFLAYGLGGLLVVCAIFGLVWFKPGVDRIIRDKEAVEKQRDDFMAANTSQVLPAIQASSEANRDTAKAITALTTEVVSLRTQVASMEREMTLLRSALQQQGRPGS